MEICGTPIKKTFSKPYKTAKGSDWKISVTVNGKKTKETLEFDTKALADAHVDTYHGKWIVGISDGENHLRDEIFDTKALAKDYIRDKKSDESNKLIKSKHQALDSEATFLDAVVGNRNMPLLDDENADKDINEDVQREIAAHKTDFDASLNNAENDAKLLLMSVAQLYLDERLINDNNYLKFKMVIEQKGLSSLVFQLDIARKALFKLSEQIHSGTHSPRNYEVLTQLQRVVLDVTKYQHEYMDDIEESMKRLSDDYDTGKMKTDHGTSAEVIESEDGEVTIIGTNNRIKLLDDINKIVEESKKEKTPQSVNDNLHVESDDSMTDAVEIRSEDENTGDDGDDDDKFGLGTM
jgi:hypothetical protein